MQIEFTPFFPDNKPGANLDQTSSFIEGFGQNNSMFFTSITNASSINDCSVKFSEFSAKVQNQESKQSLLFNTVNIQLDNWDEISKENNTDLNLEMIKPLVTSEYPEQDLKGRAFSQSENLAMNVAEEIAEEKEDLTADPSDNIDIILNMIFLMPLQIPEENLQVLTANFEKLAGAFLQKVNDLVDGLSAKDLESAESIEEFMGDLNELTNVFEQSVLSVFKPEAEAKGYLAKIDFEANLHKLGLSKNDLSNAGDWEYIDRPMTHSEVKELKSILQAIQSNGISAEENPQLLAGSAFSPNIQSAIKDINTVYQFVEIMNSDFRKSANLSLKSEEGVLKMPIAEKKMSDVSILLKSIKYNGPLSHNPQEFASKIRDIIQPMVNKNEIQEIKKIETPDLSENASLPVIDEVEKIIKSPRTSDARYLGEINSLGLANKRLGQMKNEKPHTNTLPGIQSLKSDKINDLIDSEIKNESDNDPAKELKFSLSSIVKNPSKDIESIEGSEVFVWKKGIRIEVQPESNTSFLSTSVNSDVSNSINEILKTDTPLSSYLNKSPFEQIDMKLQQMAEKGVKELTLQLAPAHLGRVEIKMEVEKDQLKIILKVESEEIKQVVESQLHRLKESLELQNVNLAKAEVNIFSGDKNAFNQANNSSKEKRSSKGSPFKNKDSDLQEIEITEKEMIRKYGYNTVEYTA